MDINFNRIQGGICFSVKLDQDDRREGVRIQGDKTKIELLTDKIFFKVSPSEINEDHIAFAALAIFLPFIGSKVKFNFTVTQSIQIFLNSPYVETWSGSKVAVASKIQSKKNDMPLSKDFSSVGIAIGGGFDAVALAIMFPECRMFHLVDTPVINSVTYFPNYRFLNGSQKISQSIGQVITRVDSNLESSFAPRGIPSWFAFIIPALIMSVDWGIRGVMTGTIFEASYMSNGRRYDDISKSFLNNPVIKTLREIGIPHYSGLAGVTEHNTLSLVARHGLSDYVSHCIMGDVDDGPCGICAKCHRKYLNYLAAKEINPLLPRSKEFEVMSYEKYNSIPYVLRFFEKSPLFFASSYTWLYEILGPKIFSPEMLRAINDQPKSLDNTKFFQPSIDVIPFDLQELYLSRVRQYFEKMTDAEVAAVHAWKCVGV